MGFYNAISQFPGHAQLAIMKFAGGLTSAPLVASIPDWWGPLTHTISGAKLKEKVFASIHPPGLKKWAGNWEFEESSALFYEIGREIWHKGSKVNLIDGGEVSFGAWSRTPASMAVEIANNPALLAAAALNAAFTTPDKVYQGSNVAVLSGSPKKVNPAMPTSFGTWYNARQNAAPTTTTIHEMLTNLSMRRAMNGAELGLTSRGPLYLLTPYSKFELFNSLLKVLHTIAGSGHPGQPLIENDGTNDVVIFGAQPSTIYQRAIPIAVSGMRDDMFALAAPTPPEIPAASLFFYTRGGQVGQYSLNEDPSSLTADSVPHVVVFPFDQNSPMFFGLEGVSRAGDIGVAALVNEGMALGSGLTIEFAYTGSAS